MAQIAPVSSATSHENPWVPVVAEEPELDASKAALTNMSNVIYDLQDSLTDHQYVTLQNAALQMYKASRVGCDESDSDESELHSNISDEDSDAGYLNSEGEENGGFLTVVESVMDRQRNQIAEHEKTIEERTAALHQANNRRYFYSRTTLALKRLLEKNGVSDAEIMDEYECVGIKQAVLDDRARRKRSREEDEEAIHPGWM